MSETTWQPGACAIAGIGTTDFTRKSGRSDLTLATQAVLAALGDAGLEASAIDGIVRCDMDLVRHNDLAEALGQRAGRVPRLEGALAFPALLPAQLDLAGQPCVVPERRCLFSHGLSRGSAGTKKPLTHEGLPR